MIDMDAFVRTLEGLTKSQRYAIVQRMNMDSLADWEFAMGVELRDRVVRERLPALLKPKPTNGSVLGV